MQGNWASIFGNVEIGVDQIALSPPVESSAMPQTSEQPPVALVRSSIEFEQGSIEVQVWLPDPTSRCQIGLASGSHHQFYAGLNSLGAPYGFGAFKNGQWEPVHGAGYGSHIQSEVWHRLKLVVQGSNVDLYFNGVKVASTSYQISRGPVSVLMQGHGRVAFRNLKIETQVPVCFVVMQFSEEFNELYSEVIRPTCEAHGYRVVRADDFYSSGMIIDDITRSIRECTVVIADVTPNNPNVFYEVGFSHGIGKPTILLSDRKRDRLPFDVSGFRTLFYDNTIGGKTAVEEGLKRHLAAILG